MSKKKYGANIAFMMNFVRKFIDEESSRSDFTLDFNRIRQPIPQLPIKQKMW